MIYLGWILLALYAVIILGTMTAVLLDNRQPEKTMAWILVLIFIPVGGIILYSFFGRNTRKEKAISNQSLDQLTKRSMLGFVEQADLHLPKEHAALIRLLSNEGRALPFKNNSVGIFTDGYGFFLSLLQAISRAKHHIHLDVYILADDALGRLIADALMDKAQEGVEVRVIYDDVGCWNVSRTFFERMRDAGIDVHAFMPVKFPAFTSKVNYRNHRKLCVIDGRIGYIGGMNIAVRYVKGVKPKKPHSRERMPWRDTHLRIEGGAVYGIQSTFLVDWYFVDRTLITNRVYYPNLNETVSNNCLAQVVTSNPTDQWPQIMQGYVRILLEAKQYVYIETPYFLPTEPVWFAMRTASLAGVDVRLMLPVRSDSRFVEWASRSYVKAAVEAGVKVYLYTQGFNHSKLMVCDDFISTCGSTNIDFRSFENNFEANAFFYDTPLALRMKAIFMEDMTQCEQIANLAALQQRPFLLQLWESVVRLFSPLL